MNQSVTYRNLLGTVRGKALLQASDLSFIGAVDAPVDFIPGSNGVPWFSYAWAATAIAPDGSLWCTANDQKAAAVFKLSMPAPGNPANALRASIAQIYGSTTQDFYQGKRSFLDSSINDNLAVTSALMWVGNVLYWAFHYGYDVQNVNHPSLGFSVLNADGTFTAYGPFRIAAGSHFTFASLNVSPDGKLVMGGCREPGGEAGPWGCSLFAVDWPTASTPAGATLNSTPYVSWDINTKQPRPEVYTEWGTSGPSSQSNVWNAEDYTGGACWIDTATKHGVIFAGRYGTIEHWYGNNPSPDGLVDTGTNAHGNHSGPRLPRMWLYDPGRFSSSSPYVVEDTRLDPNAIAGQTLPQGPLADYSTILYDAPNSRLISVHPQAETWHTYSMLPRWYYWSLKG